METVFVFLLLGLVWAAVLVPPWIENRRNAHPTASIASFHRKLWSLERMTPTYDDSDYGTYGVAPLAPGRRTADGQSAGGAPAGLVHVGDDRDGEHVVVLGHGDELGPVLPVDVPYDPGSYGDVVDDPGDTFVRPGPVSWNDEVGPRPAPVTTLDPGRERALPPLPPGIPPGTIRSVDDRGGRPPLSPAQRVELARRRVAAARRRRRIFVSLLVAALATVGPAAFLGGAWWVVHGVADALLAIYVMLLVRRQRRRSERAEKVHYLSPIRVTRPSVVVLESGTGTEQ